MSTKHHSPHIDYDGTCLCECAKCSDVEAFGRGETRCICPRCNVAACGLHDELAAAVVGDAPVPEKEGKR